MKALTFSRAREPSAPRIFSSGLREGIPLDYSVKRNMYLGFYNFYKHYNANRMFKDASSPIGDDLMHPFVFAGEHLRQLGHKVATLDMDDLEKFDVALFLDHPTFLNPYLRALRRMPGKKLYLFLFENEANRPDNYWRRNHQEFEKVFTWHLDWVDGKKYRRFYLPLKVPKNFCINREEKQKFCITIASQKYSGHPKELYSERVRAIRWFEREHPEEFDLFGTGWERRYFTGKLARLNLFLQKVYQKCPTRFAVRRFPSNRGPVASKNATMRHYKFAICYENAVFPGYLTEKIFDALFAGCVPIYLGDPKVSDQIPADCFIDKRQFKNYADLYRYLKEMPESEYQKYLSAIENFARGPAIRPFSSESFAQTILDQIVASNT